MSSIKNKFRRNFTWKKFLLITLFMFVTTLVAGCVLNYFAKDPVSELFTIPELLLRAVTAIFVGFLLSGLISTEKNSTS